MAAIVFALVRIADARDQRLLHPDCARSSGSPPGLQQLMENPAKSRRCSTFARFRLAALGEGLGGLP